MADLPRSGIVGAGFIGEVHARAVRGAGGVLAAVAGRDAESSAAAATRLLAERPLSAEQLVEADDVDVVHICTPNHLHAPLAERALAAGKHVVCEKPLSTDVDSARRLAGLAAATSVVAAVPFVYRFYPTVRDARGRVRRGDVGSLRLVHGSYLQDWLSRPGKATGASTRRWAAGPAPSATSACTGVTWSSSRPGTGSRASSPAC
jgi:predicted dehydrogenase